MATTENLNYPRPRDIFEVVYKSKNFMTPKCEGHRARMVGEYRLMAEVSVGDRPPSWGGGNLYGLTVLIETPIGDIIKAHELSDCYTSSLERITAWADITEEDVMDVVNEPQYAIRDGIRVCDGVKILWPRKLKAQEPFSKPSDQIAAMEFREDFTELKAAYEDAVKMSKATFEHQGLEVLVEYAKHLIEHLENQGADKLPLRPRVHTFDKEEPTLAEAQKLIGGYVEMIFPSDGSQLLVDEEGMLKELLVNEEATKIAGEGHVIVGPAIHLKGDARWKEEA